MNNILGQFGLGGRLADNIRERQGMAYYAFSAFDPSLGPGPLVIRAGVDPGQRRAGDRGDRRARFGQLGRDGPTERELLETRQFLIGSIPRMLETNQSIATFLQTAEFFGLGLDYDRAAAGSARGGDARGRRTPRRASCSIPSGRRWPSPAPRSSDRRMSVPATRAVFFDVDFTLIHPGPTFEGTGYREFCARHGIDVDASAFDAAVAAAAPLLDADGGRYDPAIFVDYTRRIIEGMGGAGPGRRRCAREIYDEWAACHHFALYDEVPEVLRDAARATASPSA